jgi:hypothetical protein
MLRITLVFFAFMVAAPAPAAATEDVQIRIFNYFLKRANEGDMNSQFVIGSRYDTGVGVERDKVKAYEWFAKSAAQGHPLAMQKMENHLQTERAVEKTSADKKDRTQESRPPKPAPAKPTVSTPLSVPPPVAVVAARPPAVHTAPALKAPEPAPLMVAKASPEPVVNTLDIVLKGAWKRGPSPAEYLPSVKTSCLQAGDDEVVCFSQEMQRAVGNSRLTYTVKATLSNFTKDGSFDVNYLYNVTEIDKADQPAPGQDKDGASDIAEKLGWQEPARHLDCKTSGEKTLTCIKDKRYSLQYAR